MSEIWVLTIVTKNSHMNSTELRKVSRYSQALMVLTAIHHVYGAQVYNTPWRLHVLFLSIPVIALTALLERLLLKRGGGFKSILFWLYWSIVLVASIGLIGSFEGMYNHLLKNILFYAGASHDLLLQLFPAPKYEMPNDFWFELTGVMQGGVVVPLVIYFVRLTRKVLQGESVSAL
jgi:hypothetical protein